MAKDFISRRIFIFLFLIVSLIKNQNGGFSIQQAVAVTEGVSVSNNRIILSAHPKDVTIAVSGSIVELPCLAFNDDGAKLQNIWRHNDKDILDPTESNGSLVLRDINLQQEGIYQCIILSPHSGVLLSGRAKLVVAKSPNFSAEPRDSQASVGGIVRFQCTTNGIPRAAISWFHNGLPLEDDIQRFIILPSGTLQIADLKTSDQGSYSCLASNAAGNVTSRLATLSTSGILTPSESRLRFIKAPQNISVSIGENALLECLFDRLSSKTVEFSWERADGGRLPPEDRTRTTSYGLEIRHVRTSDEGWYACVGKMSEETIRSTVYLTVNYAPILLEVPQELVKYRGEKARFTCLVSGKPKPEIVWYRDGEEITKRGRFKIIPDANMSPEKVRRENGDIDYKRDLIVSSLRFDDDQGLYQCVASNSYGETSAAATLIIKPNEIDDEGPTNLSATIVQSSDTIRLSWYIPEKLHENDGFMAFVIHFFSTELNNDKTENTRAVMREEACNDLHCKIDCCETTNFEPFTNYVFWVSAVMKQTTYTPPSNEVQITTPDAVTDGVALLTVHDSIDDGAVELKWFEPEKSVRRGETIEFRVEYAGSVEKGAEIKKTYVPYLITERSLLGFKQDVTYFFRVIPRTRAGYPSDESLSNMKNYPWIRHRTKVLSKNSTSLIVPEVVIIVNKTKAYVHLLFERLNVVECRVVLNKADDGRTVSTSFVTNETNWSITFRSLETSKYYQLTISCVDDATTYLESSTISRLFRTPKKNGLEQPSTGNPPVPFPVNLECVLQTKPKTVALIWEQLPTGSNVHHYVVRYSPKADDSEILNVSAHVNFKQTSTASILFDDLTPGQAYLFAVQTVMRDRKTSKFSDDITCFASLTAPRQPEITSADPIGNGSVYVAWKADESTMNEKVSTYYVKYKRNGSGDDAWIEVSVNGSSKGAVLTNVTSGQVYIIAVTAENEIGRSPSSNMKHVVVLETSPTVQTPGTVQKIVVSYTEGIIIGVCIALVAIVICILFLRCRLKRSNHGCPIRFSSTTTTTTTMNGCVKKFNDQQPHGGDHPTPKRCQNRELQTLLPPLLENVECDSKGGFDDVGLRFVTLSVPPMSHASSTNVDRPFVSEHKEPLVVTVESSCPDDHPEQYSDLSHSPATGSSLQSWTGQNHVSLNDHNHIPSRYNNRRRRCYHSSNSSSLSMPNLSDSGIGIDDDSVHMTMRPLNDIDDSSTTAGILALNNHYPPTNGYYVKHLSWLKDVLTREQLKDRHETKLDAFSNIDDDVTTTNMHATY